jgi:hypothetical protein
LAHFGAIRAFGAFGAKGRIWRNSRIWRNRRKGAQLSPKGRISGQLKAVQRIFSNKNFTPTLGT